MIQSTEHEKIPKHIEHVRTISQMKTKIGYRMGYLGTFTIVLGVFNGGELPNFAQLGMVEISHKIDELCLSQVVSRLCISLSFRSTLQNDRSAIYHTKLVENLLINDLI